PVINTVRPLVAAASRRSSRFVRTVSAARRSGDTLSAFLNAPRNSMSDSTSVIALDLSIEPFPQAPDAVMVIQQPPHDRWQPAIAPHAHRALGVAHLAGARL